MSIEDLLIEFIPFFCVPLCIAIFNTIIRIIKDIAQGNIEIGERKNEKKEKIKAPEEMIIIDDDLQKYFNYKE